MQSPFCVPKHRGICLLSKRGPATWSVHREPPALLCPPGCQTSSRNFRNLLFAAPSPTKHLSFFPRRHFKSSAHSSKGWIHHTHHVCPGSPHWVLSFATSLHFCQGSSHCTMGDKVHLFSIFCPHCCHVSRSCLCNPGFTLGKQIEGGRQGKNSRGKGWITPKLFSKQDGAIPGTVPLRESFASPDWKTMPFKPRIQNCIFVRLPH